MQDKYDITTYNFPKNVEVGKTYKELAQSVLGHYDIPVKKMQIFFDRWKPERDEKIADAVDMVWNDNYHKVQFFQQGKKGFQVKITLNYNTLNPSSSHSLITFMGILVDFCFIYFSAGEDVEKMYGWIPKHEEVIPYYHFLVFFQAYDELLSYFWKKNDQISIIDSLGREISDYSEQIVRSYEKMRKEKKMVGTKYLFFNLLKFSAFKLAVDRHCTLFHHLDMKKNLNDNLFLLKEFDYYQLQISKILHYITDEKFAYLLPEHYSSPEYVGGFQTFYKHCKTRIFITMMIPVDKIWSMLAVVKEKWNKFFESLDNLRKKEDLNKKD